MPRPLRTASTSSPTGRFWLAAGIAAALALGAAGAPASDVRSAPMLANTCAGCHGTDGASAGDYMPTIGGLAKGYLFEVMSDYKTGLRPSTIMGRIMRGYSDQEIWAIADFYASRPWVSTDRIGEAAAVHVGEQIHEQQCATCHEDGGRAQDDDSPRLAGQWSEYTLYALENCREQGKRCSPRKMGLRVMDLSDEELTSLADYYESQK
ncbi:MAG: c-type cytochrome [Thiohalocapsa sp.]|nr:c-type cytochrome [Thiohalocapsa sp.]MCF7991961.1 c-type cytochrome [Thiohalocapsa sp.]